MSPDNGKQFAMQFIFADGFLWLDATCPVCGSQSGAHLRSASSGAAAEGRNETTLSLTGRCGHRFFLSLNSMNGVASATWKSEVTP